MFSLEIIWCSNCITDLDGGEEKRDIDKDEGGDNSNQTMLLNDSQSDTFLTTGRNVSSQPKTSHKYPQ